MKNSVFIFFNQKIKISKILTAPKTDRVLAYIKAAKEGKKEAKKILKNL